MNRSQIAQISHVEEITGFHRSTLRRWWEAGKFPIPQKLNGKTLVWPTHLINQWIEENVKGVTHHEKHFEE